MMAPELKAVDDDRSRNIQAMGSLCGELYTDLRNEILWLHMVWTQYRVLFGASEARVQFINKAAGFFFYVLEDTLWDSVLLHISRLTDQPVVSSSRKTLTLLRLPDAIPDPEVSKRVGSIVEKVKAASKFARDWRDRRLAHRDLALVQSPNARPLTPASMADVETVLALLREVVNAIERHYHRSEMLFDVSSPSHDAQALLYHLRVARMVLDERLARLAAGDFRPEEFKQPPEI